MNEGIGAGQGTIINRTGDVLTVRRWGVSGRPKEKLVFMHGLNGDPMDVEPLGNYLQTRGVETVAWGLRGQGKDPDPKRRAMWMETDGHLDDLEDVLTHEGSGQPNFVAGESLGGLLAIRAAIEDRITARTAGFISLVPVLAVAQNNPKWTRDLAATIARKFPRVRFNASWLIHGRRRLPVMTSNEARQQAVESAPHRSQAVGLQLLVDIAELMDESTKAAEKIDAPLMIIDGGIDVFVKAETVKAFASRVRSKEFLHYHFPEANHLVLWEKEAPEICRLIGDWIATKD